MGAPLRMQAIRHYQSAGVGSATHGASPQQLVAMLFEGALDRVARARGAALNGDRATRLSNVRSSIAIIEHLRLCLDHSAGSLSARLDALYDYVLRRLTQANAAEDPAMFEDVAAVLRPIKDAWDTLPPSGRAP